MSTKITGHNIATMRLAAAARGVTANDNDAPPRIGDRVELPGMCCPGARDRVGTIADIEDSRWGRSYRVALDEGGDEWVKRVEPRDARGAECRYL